MLFGTLPALFSWGSVVTAKREQETRQKLERLRSVLEGRKALLIVLQDFPDPDALGAAAALRELARGFGDTTTTIACGGFVGRAENQAMLRYLGLNVQPLAKVNRSQFDCIAMVDTQPGAGNNDLPEDVIPDIVIDHHPMRPMTRRSPFFDVRKPYGATSTILHEYMVCAETEVPTPLATAMLYGIRSDTNDFGREAIQADINAFLSLYPGANKRVLGRIGMARVPREYFQVMMTALQKARSYGECILTSLGRIDNPDMVSEMADLLLRDQETSWAMCHAVYEEEILVSLRTSDMQADAGELMHKIVGCRGTGGGHSVMAGGQIPLKSGTQSEIREIGKTIASRFLKTMKADQFPARKLIV